MGGGAGTGSGAGATSTTGSGGGMARGAGGVSSSSSQLGTCSTVDSCGSSAGGASPCSAWRCAASVALKSSASGPSRMLARFRAIEHLLREVAIQLGGIAARVVAQHRLSLHWGLRVANRLADLRLVHQVAEVLLEDVDRFLGMQQALVEHRREDPLDRHIRVEILADHRERVLELHEPAQREVLALDRDDHTVRRD